MREREIMIKTVKNENENPSDILATATTTVKNS